MLRRAVVAQIMDPDFLYLCPIQVPDALAASRQPEKISIVKHNRHAVPGELNINFRVVHPMLPGSQNRWQCVFYRQGTAPVADSDGTVDQQRLA